MDTEVVMRYEWVEGPDRPFSPALGLMKQIGKLDLTLRPSVAVKRYKQQLVSYLSVPVLPRMALAGLVLLVNSHHRAMCRLLAALLVALTIDVTASAPLDGVASLFGTPPMFDPMSSTPRKRPIDDVEHVACQAQGSGCTPAGGCEKRNGQCTPHIGHYWFPADTPPTPMPIFLRSFLKPMMPVYHMMTARGVLEATPGFFLTTYRLLVRCLSTHPVLP